jgi:glutamate-1-semialdehyde 2,1-aminomutase
MQLENQKSHELFQQALQLIPGGVNSPVRSFNAVGGMPIFIKKANGAYLFDEDNNKYIDYIGSFGPILLGHNHPAITQAITDQAQLGLSYGAPSKLEATLAHQITSYMPGIEKCRFVNSGTEATMTAVRLARGITKRSKFIKFANCYHGHGDNFLVKAGSGALTLGIASSNGVAATSIQDTLIAEYNNIDSVIQLFEKHPNDIAAIIIEPIAGNMNMIVPEPTFLQELRDLCNQHKSLLIFDEVMTGFRVALGGAQEIYNIQPDITTLGKVIGGGLPIGAVAGQAKYMDHLAPIGDIYQAGTFSGNPLSMASGIATLNELKPEHYQQLEHLGKRLIHGMQDAAKASHISVDGTAIGGMFGLKFTNKDKSEFNFSKLYHFMLQNGSYFAPSAYEAGFISLAHTTSDIDQTLQSFVKYIREL